MLISDRIDRVLRTQLGPGFDWTAQSLLERDLTLDSLDRVELLMGLEEEFGVEISDDMCEPFEDMTVGRVAELIETQTALKPALFA